MPTLEERKRRGQDLVKKYRPVSGADPYACAADAISDILLSVAQNEDEATQILQSAEMEFRNAVEGESFLNEG
ncbi:MAG TPA: hypothetical protein VH601_23910 [Bryobacteraceae bacterium]|jgi:hypothetical protein